MEIPVIFGIVRQNGHAMVAPPAMAVMVVMIFIAPASVYCQQYEGGEIGLNKV
jgi:hypothetical protein